MIDIAAQAVTNPDQTLAVDDSGQARLVSKPIVSEGIDRHASDEVHFVNRAGWLRAAVLGANDGLLSTASLMSGVAAAAVGSQQLVLTGVAGIVAGALSMAAGEYVSVGSQADSERADLLREARALRAEPVAERDELKAIYQRRGLAPDLAGYVADALMRADALDAHARDELGLAEEQAARPMQAALASASSFLAGGIIPLATALVFPGAHVLLAMAIATLACLALLGALGAHAGGAPVGKGMVRVTLLGGVALAMSAFVGHLFHIAA
jgi:VIT1/CCC1 family predicted Fe2+/Mn2+ transporter